MEPTLLQRALDVNTRPAFRDNDLNDEDVELAIAWANGDVKIRQVQAAKGYKQSFSPLPYLARALREGIRRGFIKS